ncbi:hypothetical protein BG46_25295 [Brucella anthropi]|uniref:hypothetical protein n=1 Tax=Brucella anthropi TaxID=529 RepID=UPI000450B7F1|nr:hypothetical protein [Brucella anthropi]EXL04302.1 hypothetical protein BG46_25295 [Brucella anthropi]
MADIIDSSWNPNDEANTGVAPDGVQGGYAPSTVAPIIRAIRGAVRRSYEQINPIFTSTGSANAYVLTYPIAPEKYSKGIIYAFWANHTNTGAATLNINGLGAKAITSSDKNALVASQILADTVISVVYDGSAFRMIAASTVNPKFTGMTTLENLTVTGTTSAQAINVTTVSATGNMSIKSEANRILWFRDGDGKETGLIYNNSGNNNTHLRAYTPGETTYKEAILQPDGQLILGASPTSASAATTKSYVDTLAATKLNLSGGTVTGRVTANGGFTHGIGGGYLNIGSYNTSSYGSGFGRFWWNENTKTLELNPESGGAATFYANGTIKAASELNAGAARFTSDGNIYGSKWGNQWLYDWINSKISAVPNGRAYPRRVGGGDLNFNWSGKSGTPTWLWGWRSGDGVEAQDMNVYNPANFSVNYANSAGNANTVGGWAIANFQNDAQARANAKARKCGSWDQWSFTYHDQRMQNGTGENIYYTASISGSGAGVYLQVSPNNSDYVTVGSPTTVNNSGTYVNYTGGCVPPGWWMRIIRQSGSYNATVRLIW